MRTICVVDIFGWAEIAFEIVEITDGITEIADGIVEIEVVKVRTRTDWIERA